MLENRYHLEEVRLGYAQPIWTEPTVYFVQGAKTKRIKIGFSCFVENRLEALAFSSPDDLRTLLIMPGCKRVEAFLHSAFAHTRLHGEWFRNSRPIHQFIELAYRSGHAHALKVIGWQEFPTREQTE